MTMRKALRAWRFILLLIAPVGYLVGEQALAAEAPKTVIVFVDLSDSTRADREDYKKYFDMVLNTIAAGDRLIIGSIEKDPTGKSIIRFNDAILPHNALLEPEGRYEFRVRKTLDGARAAFSKLVTEQTDETPIIDTILESTRLFATFPNQRQILVLFSDMKEYSKGGISMEAKHSTLSDEQALVSKLRAGGRIANLAEVKIYVAGARDRDARNAAKVRTFWSLYFREAHADFSVDRYGAELLSFPECAGCKVRYTSAQ